MTTSTEGTTNTNTEVAKTAIANVEGEAQPGTGGQPAAGAAAATHADTGFASEDTALAALEAQVRAETEARERAAAAATTAAGAPATGATTAATGAPATGQPTAAGASATGAQPKRDGEQAAVAASKNAVEGAVIALRKKNRELELANASLQGEKRVLSALVDPSRIGAEGAGAGEGGAGATAEPTPAEALAAVDAKYTEIAQKVDDGELSQREAEVARAELRRTERDLTTQLAEERARAVAQETASAPQNDTALTEHLSQLVTDYPVLTRLNRGQLEPFQQLAYEQAALEGAPIKPGPLGTKELRVRMANLAEMFYDSAAATKRATARATAAAGAGGGAVSTTAGGQAKPATGGASPAGTQPTAQQREAKLTLAGNMPPDIGAIGSGATGGQMTEAQAAATIASFKNEDDVIKWMDANPTFVNRVMGNSVRMPTRS